MPDAPDSPVPSTNAGDARFKLCDSACQSIMRDGNISKDYFDTIKQDSATNNILHAVSITDEINQKLAASGSSKHIDLKGFDDNKADKREITLDTGQVTPINNKSWKVSDVRTDRTGKLEQDLYEMNGKPSDKNPIQARIPNPVRDFQQGQPEIRRPHQSVVLSLD
jgi:hypothetical protein